MSQKGWFAEGLISGGRFGEADIVLLTNPGPQAVCLPVAVDRE